jgi:hypothetical protein
VQEAAAQGLHTASIAGLPLRPRDVARRAAREERLACARRPPATYTEARVRSLGGPKAPALDASFFARSRADETAYLSWRLDVFGLSRCLTGRWHDWEGTLPLCGACGAGHISGPHLDQCLGLTGLPPQEAADALGGLADWMQGQRGRRLPQPRATL